LAWNGCAGDSHETHRTHGTNASGGNRVRRVHRRDTGNAEFAAEKIGYFDKTPEHVYTSNTQPEGLVRRILQYFNTSTLQHLSIY
jgi:hypothetical protein